jgi:uncharacterized membrane protein YeaQ/YmgE (transglycosylase-associated protein family)
MSLLGWIVLGGLAGWLASMMLEEKRGCVVNIVVGVIGGVLGGFFFSLIGGSGITGFNIWSLVVAVVGSLVFLAIVRKVRGDKKDD